MVPRRASPGQVAWHSQATLSCHGWGQSGLSTAGKLGAIEAAPLAAVAVDNSHAGLSPAAGSGTTKGAPAVVGRGTLTVHKFDQ